jgi:stage II sporulation protein D
MKKIGYYLIITILIIVILPLAVVKSCSNKKETEKPREEFRLIRSETKIKVYLHEQKKVAEMMMEEYLKGVVAAEMPAEFDIEALKAQAVAARTYAYAKLGQAKSSHEDMHIDADICTDYSHCQAWVAKEAAVKEWGSNLGDKYWSKIETSIRETENIIMTYDQKLVAQAVFHSNSGGRTENSEDVWGNEVPYLKSVLSIGEDNSKEFKTTTSIKIKDFCQKLKSEYTGIKINEKDPLKDIKVISYSDGERVKNIKIGNMTLKGTDIRNLLSLRSTNFKFEKEGTDSLKITTLGNGHGVGMSQWGANYLAKNKWEYEEILKYYYQGVELYTLGKMKNPISIRIH